MIINAVDHWPLFEELIRGEQEVYGPDCQLHLLLSLAPEASDVERVWLAGTYGAHHCVPSAWAVWQAFRPAEVVREPGKLFEWLQENWTALPVRPEMRSHRMVAKRHQCLYDFAVYALGESWRTGTYQEVWEDAIESVKYMGRYMNIKYMELLRRIARPDMVLSDMRAKNGWSPRIALGLFFPSEIANIIADKKNNTQEAINLTEKCATEVIQHLAERGITVSYFQLQVVMCNMREALLGTFYPAAGMDEEMDYIKIAETKFDMSHVWETRKRIFPHQYLGELNGWFGLRQSKYQEWKNKGRAIGFV